ncbi:phage tail protein [Lachnospiraceae bacterium 64-25]
MIDFYNGLITDILPDNIKSDPVVAAIGYAISNMAKKIVDHADGSGIYASIDVLDEEVLDLLAAELRTKYYGSWMTLEEKRQIVKKTLLWYCRAGTPCTVQELIDFVFQDAYVEEWFQYGSSAFLFRVVVNVISQDVPLEKYLNFIQSLYGVKNTRSHLEAVIFSCKKDTEVKSVAAAGTGNTIKIKPSTAEKIKAATESRCVSVLLMSQTIIVKTDNSIKDNEVYLITEDGAMERVTDSNGAFIKTRE